MRICPQLKVVNCILHLLVVGLMTIKTFYNNLAFRTAKNMSFTCIACHVAFADPEVQRAHYKSDWHRYNLKRKVLAMPPVSAATFQDKVLEHRDEAATQQNNEGISGFSCKVCQKKFSSHNAFDNHKKSKKHKDFEKKYLENIKDKVSIASSDIETTGNIIEDTMTHEEMIINKAVGDARVDISKPKILTKEAKTHDKRNGFGEGDNPRLRWLKKQVEELDDDMWEDLMDEGEVEDSEDVKDEDADMASLASESSHQRMISVNECLFCDKVSHGLDDNVIHMSHKHSFFIPDMDYIADLEALVEYLGEKVGVGNVCLQCNENGRAFFSLAAVQKHMLDKGHCQMLFDGEAALEYADFYNYDEVLETDSDSDSDSTETESMELVLPSGGTIGHRSLMRYYKQKFPTVDRPAYHLSRKKRALDRVMAQYRAIGWRGSTASEITQKRKDIAFVQKMKSKYQVQLGSKNNKTQMKHFRIQFMNAG